MASLGHTLREARLKSGLTLELISSKTCISLKNLQAIEEDDLSQVTSAFFYRSFVRQYCEQVGLRYESLADAVSLACAYYPDPLRPDQLETVVQRSLVTPHERKFNPRTLVAVASFTVVLAGCTLLYPLLQGRVADLPQTVSNAVEALPGKMRALRPFFGQAKSGKPNVASEKPESNLTAQAKAPDASATANGTVAAGQDTRQESRFQVQLSAIEPSWLSLVADGRQTFSGILEPAESKTLECRDSGRVRTGNAGGVRFVFNGKPVGVVGPRGQVRIIVFTKSNYEVLEPSPVAETTPRPFELFSALMQPRLSY